MMRTLPLDGASLSWKGVEDILAGTVCLTVPASARQRMKRSRQMIDAAVQQGRTVYGVTTGFGRLASVSIAREDLSTLQRNLILSHAVGVGPSLPIAETRLFMACRINALAKGYSGIRPETVDALITLYNKNLLPVIPEQGSVGASGDLAPLAHLALVLLGEGEAWYHGKKISGRQALKIARLKPLTLQAKEGLALINGTQLMLALGASVWLQADRLANIADVAGAMTLEALHGCADAFHPAIHRVRPHPGQQQVAAHIRRLIAGSRLIGKAGRVQDAYSLRCMPQVHGAVRDALAYVKEVLERELNAATDNPLVFPHPSSLSPRERGGVRGMILSGGNFHGQPLSLALDMLGIAVAQLAVISERRIERLVNPDLSGLPPFLAASSGLQSGLMMAQVTAAALTSENKIHAHPASVDSIPTSANQEDMVSMGVTAARKARQIVENTSTVLAIELLSAAQALEFSDHRALGKGTRTAYQHLRKSIRPLKEDRVLSNDLKTVASLIPALSQI